MGYTNFPNGVTSFGVPLPNMTQDISGSTFFVDNNSGSDSNDGSSFERAFKTFAKAVAVNNIDIARGSDRWARRNTIYYCADTETATIVAFPNKCDVIGVGSYDANSKPGITGNHAPVNTGNYGTRFINMWFKAPAVATGINTANNNNVWISTNSNNQLMINGNCSVAVYNAIGQRIAAMNMTSNTTTLETPLQSGIYFVTIRNAGKSVTQKVIIN